MVAEGVEEVVEVVGAEDWAFAAYSCARLGHARARDEVAVLRCRTRVLCAPKSASGGEREGLNRC